jgi:hypothetical protein
VNRILLNATAAASRRTPSAPVCGDRSSPRRGVDFDVRAQDLRQAHASWLLAGGYDFTSMTATAFIVRGAAG